MFISKLRIVSTVLALSIVPLAAGLAAADEVHVVVPAPFFIPQAEFRYEDGYYRTHEGHYYHYDRDRDGWHYGRDHREGVRWERRHEGRGR
jgi:hypothetical protein